MGNFKNSAPCKNCLSVIMELKIKRLIFSTDDNDFRVCKACDYETEHVSVGNRWLQKNPNKQHSEENKQPNIIENKQQKKRPSTA